MNGRALKQGAQLKESWLAHLCSLPIWSTSERTRKGEAILPMRNQCALPDAFAPGLGSILSCVEEKGGGEGEKEGKMEARAMVCVVELMFLSSEQSAANYPRYICAPLLPVCICATTNVVATASYLNLCTVRERSRISGRIRGGCDYVE